MRARNLRGRRPPPSHQPAMAAADESRLASDAFAFLLNIASSVLIVFVNKMLMDPRIGYKFTFGARLPPSAACPTPPLRVLGGGG